MQIALNVRPSDEVEQITVAIVVPGHGGPRHLVERAETGNTDSSQFLS
jgi:hypothetical protein